MLQHYWAANTACCPSSLPPLMLQHYWAKKMGLKPEDICLVSQKSLFFCDAL